MVYYHPNCATTTSHANRRPDPPQSAEILAAANAVILGKRTQTRLALCCLLAEAIC
jgi:hypothetical protein